MSKQINRPQLWADHLPVPKGTIDKYGRGHALILAAGQLTGATRLAATSCSRIGAGLVSVLAARRTDVYRASLPPQVMVWDGVFAKPSKVTVVLVGCGGVETRAFERLIGRSSNCHQIFDAGAIPAALRLRAPDRRHRIITPHRGEFDRTFPPSGGSIYDRAAAAARQTSSFVVLKGAETIIVAPDGNMVVNRRSSPYLATAGTGDVLAGMICGLVAQKMPPFEACCAAVWMHSEAALRFGPGLVASDIPDFTPAILGHLLAEEDMPD